MIGFLWGGFVMKFARCLFYCVSLCSFCISNGISAFSGEDPEIAKLQEEIEKLKAEIETLKAENQDLEHSRASIDENSERIKKLEEEAGSQTGQSPDNDSASQIEELNKKIEELKDKEEKLRLETAQADARLEKIESQNHPVTASAIALVGKGLDFLSSQFNANEIVRQISNGKSVAATASNLTEEERTELRTIESDIKTKGFNPENQARLNTFNERVATREIEANKFQQVTFYGINEGFKDNVTIAYILYQARLGNRANTEDILTGKINTVDQELIDTIYDMAQSGAKMPDILRNIKLIFNGAPMKVIKKPTIAPAIIQQPLSAQASQTCSVQLPDFTAQTSQNSSTNDAMVTGQTQSSNQGNAAQTTIPSINATNAQETQTAPSVQMQSMTESQGGGQGHEAIRNIQIPQNVTGSGVQTSANMPLSGSKQSQEIVRRQEASTQPLATDAQGNTTNIREAQTIPSVQMQSTTESQGGGQGHEVGRNIQVPQNVTGSGVQTSANMPLSGSRQIMVNSEAPLAQSQGSIKSQEVGAQSLAIQNDRIAAPQQKVVNPASQPMQKIIARENGAIQQTSVGAVPVLPNANEIPQNGGQVADSNQRPIASGNGDGQVNAVQQQLLGQSALPPQPQVVDRTQSQQPANPTSKGSLTVMDVESNTYYEVPTDKFSIIAKPSSGFPPKTSVNGRELSPLDIKSADALKRLHTS
jgi:cell division protein FtsB